MIYGLLELTLKKYICMATGLLNVLYDWDVKDIIDNVSNRVVETQETGQLVKGNGRNLNQESK